MLKQFPRAHFIAAFTLAAVAAGGLMLSPGGDVEAQRISVSFNIDNGKLEPIAASAIKTPATKTAKTAESGVDATAASTTERNIDPPPEQVALLTPDPATDADAVSSTDTPTVTAAANAPEQAAAPVTTAAAPEAAIASANAAEPASQPSEPLVLDVPPELEWQEFTVKSGDTLSTLFRKAGYSDALMYKVIQGDGKKLARLYKGNQLRFGSEDNQLLEVVLVKSLTESLRTQLTGERYVTKAELRKPEIELAFATGEIENSLFIAGTKAGLNSRITMDLAGIFGWDIDFVYDIRKGDKFDVLYEKQLLDGETIGDGNILAATFTNRGRKITAVRYTDSNGRSAFYSPTGASIQKAFLRAPIDARISSSFNLQRRHPILNVVRPHEGTDYAAAPGSPILAAGDGRVRHMGTKGGYGRTVILQHGDGITTLYAHMSRYGKGMASGKTVKQGQTIGYVGSSGMATGPHLHYEFRMNGAPRNSRTVKLPDAAPVPKQEMARFKAFSNKLVARLDSGLQETQLALAEEE